MIKGWDFPRQTRHIWLIACFIIIIVAATGTVIINMQVSGFLTNQIKETLIWEAKLYSTQLEHVFHEVKSGLDSAVLSRGIKDGDRDLIQENLNAMKQSVPSMIRGWVIDEAGQLTPSYNTRVAYLGALSWWQTFLAQGSLRSLGHTFPGSRMFAVQPVPRQNGLTPILPLIRFETRNSQITRMVVMELDINHALWSTGDWASNPVSLYTADGHLVARPYDYFSRTVPLLSDQSADPLMQIQRDMADEDMGFAYFDRGGDKRAGVFVRVPSLGMVIAVERSAQEVFQPVRYIAWGSLIMTVLSLSVATAFAYTLYNTHRKLREAEQLTLSAEFRALQANINPHFLFNTLDRIAGKAFTDNKKDVTGMLRALADLFRYTVRGPNQLVTVREELSYLDRYVYLQQQRFGDRFEYRMYADDALLAAQIPKFSIQPVVENAFVHAVEQSMDPVTIRVWVQRNEDEMVVTVTDNGPGMEADNLKRLNALLHGDTRDKGDDVMDHIGLFNMHRRLRTLYGRPYGLSIKSLPQGLSVQIICPIVFDEEDGSTGRPSWPSFRVFGRLN